MLEDRYGLPLSISSTAARDAYVEGVDAVLSATGDALGPLDRALELEPGFALALSAKARFLQVAGDARGAREAGEQAMGHRGDGGLSPQKNNSSSSRIEVNSDDTSNVLYPSDAVLGVESADTAGLVKDSGSVDPDSSDTEARVEERTHGGRACNDGKKRTNPDLGTASEGLGPPKSVEHTGFATKNELDLEALIDELDQSDL